MTWILSPTRSWLRLEQCIEIFFTEIPASVGGIPQVPSPSDAKERSSCSVLSCPPGAFDSGVRVKVLCRIMAGVKGEGLSCTEEKEVYFYLDNYLVYKPNEFVWA